MCCWTLAFHLIFGMQQRRLASHFSEHISFRSTSTHLLKTMTPPPSPEPPDILLLTASTEEGLGEEDENDCETPIVDGFENVFTENVFNEFMW